MNDVDKPADQASFSYEGTPTTVAEYFAVVKSYVLKYPKLPTLWVGNPKGKIRVLVPLELCSVRDGQPLMTKANENQTRAMIKYASTNTEVRKAKIERYFDYVFPRRKC